MGLADALFRWLERSADANRTDELDDFLATLAGEPRGAFLWSRLLDCAAENQANLAGRTWELTACPPSGASGSVELLPDGCSIGVCNQTPNEFARLPR